MKDNENRDLYPTNENQDYTDDYDQDSSPEYDAVDS